jgi:phosphate acetyltransferase
VSHPLKVPDASQLLDALRRRAAERDAEIVLAEGTDSRIVAAAFEARRRGVARPLVLGSPAAVAAAAREAGVAVTFDVLDPHAIEPPPEMVELLLRRLAGKGLTEEEIRALVQDPLHHACLRVATGRSHGAVMGAVATTAETLRAALRCVGLREGLKTVSSCFLMVLADGRGLIYSDCGVVPYPKPEQLADIAEAAAQSCRQLLQEEPRVALLSFSTLGSASHPRLVRLREALEILRSRGVDFAVDGELQADAALVPAVALRKAPGSPVAGRANVLVFPDLDSGNIAYKLTERLAGARAVGPILQGLAKPVHDLSRGCSRDDVLDAMAVAVLEGDAG